MGHFLRAQLGPTHIFVFFFKITQLWEWGIFFFQGVVHKKEEKVVIVSLTYRSSVPTKIPAPPDAKLTPVKNDLLLDANDRYGGEVGRPTFSAAHK